MKVLLLISFYVTQNTIPSPPPPSSLPMSVDFYLDVVNEFSDNVSSVWDLQCDTASTYNFKILVK